MCVSHKHLASTKNENKLDLRLLQNQVKMKTGGWQKWFDSAQSRNNCSEADKRSDQPRKYLEQEASVRLREENDKADDDKGMGEEGRKSSIECGRKRCWRQGYRDTVTYSNGGQNGGVHVWSWVCAGQWRRPRAIAVFCLS
jgi:hypothetical protein